MSSGLRRRSEKNSFSNASWLSVRISSWLIIREPRTVEWAKASIEKKNFKFKSGRVGSGRVSNLELVDNKRAPNSRVGKGIRIISFIFFIFHRIRQETFKKLHYFLYCLHFSSHSTRNIQKLALFPFFSSFFIAFNKTKSKNCIISLHFLHFSWHSTRNIQKITLFPLFSSFFIAFNKKH